MPRSSAAIQQTLIGRENGQNFLSAAGNQLDQPANKIGRQGQIKDVRSIIANFRQTHPEQIPRRGRRLKNVNQNIYLNDIATGNDNDALIADLLAKRNNDISSPPTSNDSNYSNSQILMSKAGPSNQFASLTGLQIVQRIIDTRAVQLTSIDTNLIAKYTSHFHRRIQTIVQGEQSGWQQ